MDVKYINPFIGATLHVLETIASTKAEAGKLYLKKDQMAKGDVSAVIGLSGEAKGTISVSFTKACIFSIVSKMFGEQVNELNSEIQDAAGEIANMISGHARQKLEEMGQSMTAAIPSVVIGESHTISHMTKYPIVAIPFKTDSGEFTIEVCIETGKGNN